MAETRLSTSNSKKRFALQFLLFLAGLLVIDSAFAVYIESTASANYREAVKSKADFDPNAAYDTWILGDSLPADGIVPAVLRAETNKSVYNWGVNASSPFEWEILLRDLESRAKLPKYVVIGCNIHMFIKRPNDGPFVAPAIKSPLLQADLLRGSVERSDLSAILASGRKRLLWKGSLANSVRGNTIPEKSSTFDKGFITGRKGMTPPFKPMIDALRFDPENAKFQVGAFEQMVVRCANRGSKIAFVKMPIHTLQLEIYQRDKRTWDHYQSEVARIAKEYNCEVFEGQTPEFCNQFSSADFVDGIHLSNDGAVKFSKELGEWLRVTWP